MPLFHPHSCFFKYSRSNEKVGLVLGVSHRQRALLAFPFDEDREQGEMTRRGGEVKETHFSMGFLRRDLSLMNVSHF